MKHSKEIQAALYEFGMRSIAEVTPMDALDIIACLTNGWAAELASHVYFQGVKQSIDN